MPERRRREKAEWTRTNTTWEVRKVVWHHWALGHSAEKTLDYLPSMPSPPKREGSKRKGSGIPEDRTTIFKIRDELSDLPPYLARKLVEEIPEIRSFIEDKRPDLKGKLSQDQRSKPIDQPDWIEDHEEKYGHPPIVPERLRFLFPGYIAGEPMSKDMKPGIPSMQAWNRLLPSEQDMVYDILRWLGIDPRDFDKKMRSLAAPGGPGPIKLTYK
jgi:hypothetical protein